MKKAPGKHKISTLLILLLCSCLLVFCGCRGAVNNANNQEPLPPAETKEIPLTALPQEIDLLYLGREGDFDYFIDPVLPQQELKVTVDKRASQFLNKIHPFTLLQLVYDDNNPQGRKEMRISSLSDTNTHFFCGVTTPPGQSKEATYGKEFLDSFLFTRLYPALSISDYQLLKAEFTPLDESNHMFRLSLTANLLPETTEFQTYGYKWGNYSEKSNTITEQHLSTLLYYYNGKWGCYIDPERQVPLLDGYRENPIVPTRQTLYTVEEQDFSQVFEGKSVQEVFYEDSNYSYLSQTIFVITEKSPDSSTIESGYFRTQLLQYERETTYQREMALLGENLHSPRIIAKNQTIAYLTTSRTIYPDGIGQGNLLRWDLESGKVETLFPNATPLLTTTNEILLLQSEPTDTQAPGIYRIHIGDGTIDRVSNLPGEPYASTYEDARLARKTIKKENGVESTYLYLLYPNRDYTRQDFHDAFIIHMEQGKITRLP